MKAAHKLCLTLFSLFYILTLLFVAVWAVLGLSVALWSLLFILGIILLGGLIFSAGPIIEMERIYSRRPPRQVYEQISSRNGYCLLSDISKWFIFSVRIAEDNHFFKHKGIDFSCLFTAFASDIFNKKKAGASTITQQLIKNVYLTPEKSLKRKVREFIMTRRMERELSKNEILELYVNIINYGHGKFGISSAADYYYHCTPAELSFDQSLSLAAILPCPDRYNEKANPVYYHLVRQNLFKKIVNNSDLSFDEMDEIIAEYRGEGEMRK